ncbi:MAG: hypothetical protein FWE83_11040 [Oscillospiraceae bacterium]|nr:hypothetical protein [Oscillospiraceae bacterium]
MSYYIGNYTSVHPYHKGKKGYINKFEKSLKLPFLNVLQNNLPAARPDMDEDIKLNDSDIVISDNVQLSSAVVTATGAGDSDPALHSG